ncbi:MAG: membrane protein insertase YidC [bacterium]
MENKNFIMAIILSVAVMFIWSSFFAPQPEQQPPLEKKSVSEAKESAPEVSEKIAQKKEVAKTLDAAPVAGVTHPEVTGTIKNDSLELSYSSLSGKITKALIVKEKYVSKDVDLSAAVTEGSFFPEISSVFGSEPTYQVTDKTDSSVTLQYESGSVVETKTIKLLEDFKVAVEKTVTNNGEGALSWKPFLAFDSQHENSEILSAYNKKFNIVAYRKSDGFKEMSDNKDVEKFLSKGSKVDWVGVNYGYFIFALIPDGEKFSVSANIDSKNNRSWFKAESNSEVIAPGESYSEKFVVYYGPKEIELLKKEDISLEKSVTFGWTGFLAEPLLIALNFFYKFVKNYGLAIIILTFIVKLLLFPLSNASYKSMNKMRALQPKIKELQEKYKKDKEALNKETMLLYQKEGVNPLGGCLPMFIQMPVYIALYYMIQNAVELYNAPFLPFWLTDLSEKDPFFIIPVSLGLLMFFQTKLTPQATENAQAKIMMYTMPVVFTWISLFLPSGMTLYWFVNTILGIAQQLYVSKKYSPK